MVDTTLQKCMDIRFSAAGLADWCGLPFLSSVCGGCVSTLGGSHSSEMSFLCRVPGLSLRDRVKTSVIQEELGV